MPKNFKTLQSAMSPESRARSEAKAAAGASIQPLRSSPPTATSLPNIISLGAGVQSSTMALMAAHGELQPMPELAVFADTGDEPQSVYAWLGYLTKLLPFPVVCVSGGKLSTAALRVRRSKKSGRIYSANSIPVFTLANGKRGMMGRRCTTDHKIRPIQSYLKKYFGIKGLPGHPRVIQWLGISADEAHRMKPSKFTWLKSTWPLVDAGITRQQCFLWMEKMGYRKPPRSACVFCPYHSDREWARLKSEEPAEFAKAVVFEKRLQESIEQQEVLTGVPYLHASRQPLNSVEFDTADYQADQFGNECEGMCGV